MTALALIDENGNPMVWDKPKWQEVEETPEEPLHVIAAREAARQSTPKKHQ